MRTKRAEPGSGLALGAVVAIIALAGGVRAAEKHDSLRKKALELNRLTGQEPIKAKIDQMVDDPAGSKKLLAEAAAIGTGKDQPFNINATYILAQVAQRLKEVDTS